MKNVYKYILISFLALIINTGNSQTTMLTILNKGETKIKELEKDNNTVVHIEFDIVHKGYNKEIYRKLYNTRTYYFYAFASDRVTDLDMELYFKKDGEWEKVKTDVTTANYAYIAFTPEETGKYGILIKGYQFAEDYTASHYGLIIYNDVGQTSIKSIYQTGKEAIEIVEEQGYEVVHLEYDVLSTSSTEKSLQRDLSEYYDYTIIAFGDDNITGIDIKLYEDYPTIWKFIDEDSDNSLAAVSVAPDSTNTYLIKVIASEFEEYQTAGYFGLIVAHTDKESPAPSNKSLSNLRVSTKLTKYGVYANSEIKITSKDETVTLFEFNEKVTQFKHTTETMSSTYFITSKEYDSDDNSWTIKATSDTGDDYTLLVELDKDNLSIFYVKDDEIKLVIYKIKSTWRN